MTTDLSTILRCLAAVAGQRQLGAAPTNSNADLGQLALCKCTSSAGRLQLAFLRFGRRPDRRLFQAPGTDIFDRVGLTFSMSSRSSPPPLGRRETGKNRLKSLCHGLKCFPTRRENSGSPATRHHRFGAGKLPHVVRQRTIQVWPYLYVCRCLIRRWQSDWPGGNGARFP